MKQVDFYVLEDASSLKAQGFACQLLEKHHQDQKKVFIHFANESDATRFDALLWTFKEDSFIPHSLYQASAPFPPLIQLGWGEAYPQNQDILLNLATFLPAYYQHFPHIIEIVFSDPTVQQLARERYRTYRDQGCDIKTYKP